MFLNSIVNGIILSTELLYLQYIDNLHLAKSKIASLILKPRNMSKYKFIDIAVNLTDPMFAGFYNEKRYHISDVNAVLARSKNAGIEKLIVTGTNLEESKKAMDLATHYENLYCTIGCHPTNCSEIEKKFANTDDYFSELEKLSKSSLKVVAFGECGLDYDRLHFCPKDVQKKYFRKQLELNETLRLPLFLHCRNATEDLLEILCDFPEQKGVIHSFTDSSSDLNEILKTNYFIGINGCSLKTQENIEVVKEIPNDRIMLETDSPWCDIRKTHVSYSFLDPHLVEQFEDVKKEKWSESKMVRGRNEPAKISLIFDALHKIKNEDPTKLCSTIYENTNRTFFS